MADIKPDRTIPYKTVGDLEIPMDIYLPKGVKNAPVLLWFHGGGLLQGRRDLLASHMRRGVQTHGYICISADYRLAPQVALPEIHADLQDCIAFIRTELSALLGEPDIMDATRLAVSGSSAGGYLALLAGLYARPKPKVILPIYPITDPLGTFFTTSQPPPPGRRVASAAEMASYLDPASEVLASAGSLAEGDARANIYVYMTHAANLAQLLGIADPERAEKWRISRNVQEHGLPPAYFLHGDADTAVGVEQSDEVVGAMVGLGLDVQYERLHGKDHHLDNDPEWDDKAFYAFLMRYL